MQKLAVEKGNQQVEGGWHLVTASLIIGHHAEMQFAFLILSTLALRTQFQGSNDRNLRKIYELGREQKLDGAWMQLIREELDAKRSDASSPDLSELVSEGLRILH